MVRQRVLPTVKHLFPCLTLVALSAAASARQGFVPADDAGFVAEAARLLWLRGASDITATWSEAGVVAAGCGSSTSAQQIGITRGLAAVNGFVLANGWVEALDEDGPATASPGGCIGAEGGVGAVDCTSVDPVLSALASDLALTQDAAVVEIAFTLQAATVLRFAYEFVTFEDPVEPAFFDGFAIALDGQLVAGGTTHLGPEAGSDPWSLTPSLAVPAYEYQSQVPAAYHQVPAWSTGRRELVLDLAAGVHALSFHVADSRAGGTGLGCAAASDQIVSSALIVGVHELHGGPFGVGVTAGTTLGATHWTTVGHPVAGGRFGADFQLVLEGIDAPALGFLFSASTLLDRPFVIGPVAPLELLLLGPALIDSTTGFGSLAFPPSGPVDVPSSATGSTLLYQVFGLDTNDGRAFVSPAKPLLF